MARSARVSHLLFGAKVHDPAFWDAHPMVVEAETNFDGSGWIHLTLTSIRQLGPGVNTLRETSAPETRDGADLYFWGEGDCPLALFEHAPGVREARFWIEGPIEGDDRTCWSVGLWLAR